MKTTQRLSWVRNNISDQAHWETQKGTNSQARDYTMKEESAQPESFREFGRFVKGPGARTDLTEFKNAIKSGANQRELIDTHTTPMAKYGRFYHTVRSLYQPIRTQESHDEFKVILYVGAPRTGKTKRARQDHEDLYAIPVSNGTLWFDGYDLHKTVLIDDFAGRASKMQLSMVLQLLDRYPIQIPMKGSFVWWMPDIIIVTSNFHPRNWYNYTNREQHWLALSARFHEVWYFPGIGEEAEEQIPEEYFQNKDLWPDDVNNTDIHFNEYDIIVQ